VRRVLVLADHAKVQVERTLGELEPWLAARVARVEVHHDLRELSQEAVRLGRPPFDELHDLIVVLGGDGSILSAVRTFSEEPVPILGINFGRVGFLASVAVGDWEEALGEVLGGRAVLEPRMRIVAEFDSRAGRARTAVALNDVVVARGAVQGMLSMSLTVGDHWVTDYRADALIVATPSGSTAHSLAAGGPILAPSMNGFVVTPVCPQSLSHRPLVLHPDSVLRVEVDRSSGLTTLAVDGQGFFPLRQGDCARVWRHPVAYPILARPGSNPYRRVRERLGWRGSFEPGPNVGARRQEEPDEGDLGQGEKL
jgi:NAD+ kinase